MWLGLFVFGSMWFWGLMFIEFALLCYYVEKDKYAASTVSVIVILLALWLLGDFNVLKWIMQDPARVLVYFVTYIGIGLTWSFCKFYSYVRKIRRQFERNKANWYDAHPLTQFESSEARDAEFKRTDYTYGIPSFSQCREKIAFWMVYWPVSMFWTVLNDPIRRLCVLLSDSFIEIYKSMYRRALGDIVDSSKMRH